jgi:hypothetical protein
MVKVLNIAGCGRSGSTILGNILGQIPGFVHLGELCYVWDRGFLRNTLCGCGDEFHNCPFWSDVVAQPGMVEADFDYPRLARVPRQASRHTSVLFSPDRTAQRDTSVGHYVRALGILYRAIQDASGCAVIVDSSKVPAHSSLLGVLPDIELYYVHLVRDPRAVAYSWRRKLIRHDGGGTQPLAMDQTGAGRAAMKWLRANATMEIVRRRRAGRVLYQSYEDFVSNPSGAARRISAFLAEDPGDLSFIGPSTVALQPSHTVWGNYNRLQTGTVDMRLDVEWKQRMGWLDRTTVTALTWPMLLRYRGARRHADVS